MIAGLGPTQDFFLKRMLLHDHDELEGRINILENGNTIIEIWQPANSTTGVFRIPKTGGGYVDPGKYTFVLGQWPGAFDIGVAQMDSSGIPLDQIAVDMGGNPITGTMDLAGNYTLSAVPSSYPVGIVAYVEMTYLNLLLECDISYIANRFDIEVPGGGRGGGAPTTAKYLLTQTNISLPNAISLGTLSDGLLNISVVGGIATVGTITDYLTSAYIGSSNLVTLGTIGTGVWHGSAIADSYISSATTWNAKLSNPLTTVGDLLYCSVTGTPGTIQRLPADTTDTRKFLRTQSISGVPQISTWDTLQSGDIPSLSSIYVPVGRTLTINGSTYDLSANRTWSISLSPGGTANQIQFNSGGSTLGGMGWTWNSGTDTVNGTGGIQSYLTMSTSAGTFLGYGNFGCTVTNGEFLISNSAGVTMGLYGPKFEYVDGTLGFRVDMTPTGMSVGDPSAFTPTAKIHISAGSTGAGSAPLKITLGGNLLTTPEAGAIEAINTHLYWTDSGGTRYQIDQQSGGSMTWPIGAGIVVYSGSSSWSSSISGTSSQFVKGDGSLDSSTYLTTLTGAVLTNQATPQTIGLTGSRLAKLWATDITVTNTITGSINKATNLIGGNNTTLLGSIPYQSNTDTTLFISPNVSTTKKFLNQTGNGTNGAVPTWDVIADGDIPATLLRTTLTAGNIFVGAATTNIATGVTLTLSGTAGTFGLSSLGVLTMPDAATGTRGLLNSSDWNTFSGKLSNVLTTIGDLLYCSVTGTPGTVQRLGADTSNTRKFLRELSVTGTPTAPAWDTLLATDIPDLSTTYIKLSQSTPQTIIGGKLTFPVPTASYASLCLGASSAVNPSAPVSGDLWWNGTNLNFYNGSTTKDLLAGGTSLTKATYTDVNTGTDDAKYMTSLSIASSNYAKKSYARRMAIAL